jgi:cold shock protein
MATGVVKWFNGQKGFGFIQPLDGGNDVFVHISAVERAGLTGLGEGQKLSYDLKTDKMRGKTSAENLALIRIWSAPRSSDEYFTDVLKYLSTENPAGDGGVLLLRERIEVVRSITRPRRPDTAEDEVGSTEASDYAADADPVAVASTFIGKSLS